MNLLRFVAVTAMAVVGGVVASVAGASALITTFETRFVQKLDTIGMQILVSEAEEEKVVVLMPPPAGQGMWYAQDGTTYQVNH